MDTYSHIRGFNYVPSTACNDIEFWRDYDPVVIERELGYAQRLGLNSARVFLAYVVYEHEPQVFLDRLTHFVRAACERGISTVPVLWDSCFSEEMPDYASSQNVWYPNPGVKRLGEEFYASGEAYCRDVVQRLKGEPGLLMWDIHNEPLMTRYLDEAYPDREQRMAQIWRFVEHFARYVKSLDADTPITVGAHTVDNMEVTAAYIDVLGFHDYSATEVQMDAVYKKARQFADKYHKPLIINEIGCPARANPYDIAIETAMKWEVGYYLWELMIGRSFWNDRHGVVYPDGSVRDPSTASAIGGFFRKRTDAIIPYNVNTESMVDRLKARWEALRDTDDSNLAERISILTAMAYLLESGELVPMCELPTVKVRALKAQGDVGQAAELYQAWMSVLAADAERKAGQNYDAMVN